MRNPSVPWIAAVLLVGAAAPGAARGIGVVDRSGLEGLVSGRVCRDVDGDGACSGDEPGQAGVRLVLASGQEVRTDADGRYAIAALASRVPLAEAGGRFERGRHRLRLDPRSLPAGLRAATEAVTFEVVLAGAALVDFALRASDSSSEATLRRAETGDAPAVGWGEEGLTYEVRGRVEPDAQVRIGGARVPVAADGHYRVEVPLRPGSNALALQVSRATGEVELYTQQVEVLEREQGLLFVPAPPSRWGRVVLPGLRDAVSAGAATLTFELPPGTRVELGALRALAGEDGRAALPLVLGVGRNPVAVRLILADGTVRDEVIEVQGALRPFAVGLLDLELGWDPRARAWRLEGEGRAHGELRWDAWRLEGELALDHRDVTAAADSGGLALLMPRRPERFERALDPDLSVHLPGIDSATLTPNPSEGRLRLLLAHETLGRVGFGTHRFQLDGTELGRVHRAMFGLFGDGELAITGDVALKASLAADLGLADPTVGIATRPVHEEHRATGGSVFYLRQGGLSEGSERLRVELRDGISGLPLAERHLVRGRDYELDARAGRILLAQALSFVAPIGGLGALPLTGHPEQVLVIDYAALDASATPSRALGGALSASVLGAELGVGGMVEEGGHRIARAHAHVPVGTLLLAIEAARSVGSAQARGDFVRTDDGGLTSRAVDTPSLTGGEALTLRLKGETFGSGGTLDASYRVRTPGFSDDAHADVVRFRQASVRLEQPVEAFLVSVLADDREGQVAGGRYEDAPYRGRSLGAALGWSRDALGLRAEVRDESLSVSDLEGGRLAVGAEARVRVHERLGLLATHRQVITARGAGPGALDDTFASVGADLEVEPGARVGLRAGWGPTLGPLVWLEGERQAGRETFYGSVSTDVDGPDVGTLRSVSGARTEVGDGSAVFVEDVASHDALTIRTSRAVGAYQRLGGGWDARIRYEQGVRDPIGGASPLTRSAGSLGLGYVGERLRLHGRIELWGQGGLHGALLDGERRQALAALSAEARLAAAWTLAGRLHASDSTLEGARAGRFVEGSVGLAWHPGPWLVASRYALTYERPPASRPVTSPRMLQVVSLLPAAQLGDRLGISGATHLGLASDGVGQTVVFSGAVRPSLRVIDALELAAELAGRSAAPDGGSLWALRGEVGWRLGLRGRLALGYTAFGFSGLGLVDDEEARGDRVYLRAELAW